MIGVHSVNFQKGFSVDFRDRFTVSSHESYSEATSVTRVSVSTSLTVLFLRLLFSVMSETRAFMKLSNALNTPVSALTSKVRNCNGCRKVTTWHVQLVVRYDLPESRTRERSWSGKEGKVAGGTGRGGGWGMGGCSYSVSVLVL